MNQKQNFSTVSEYFKTSKILFGAFILGIINFGIVLVILFFLEMLPLGGIDQELTLYAIAGSIAMFVLMGFVGNLVFKNKISKAIQELNFSTKLSLYREAKMIQAVTLEASALFAMVFILILTHVFFIVIAFLSVLQMIRNFPKKSEMIEVLDLSYSDQQKLNNPDFKLN